ncbi:unnamed protein product [Adineta steineri]|uniref:Serine hydrolase domain-containing protein n=1 Tax=Adineta steineri TaxID=433720 RepID=A0A815RZB0_9BILA|nr:unnamed protein product [Adineta steineri]CAF3763020.1 unnamed protein product [Adineta steineri]
MATNVSQSKTRILVLHGYYDSAQNREYQMRSLVRSMKDIDFVFINSPFPFVNYDFLKSTDNPSNEERYQWMSYKPTEWSVSAYDYDTIKESIEYITNYINQNGPFDGLLGFSQGAIVCVTMLLDIPNWSILPACIKFVILVGCPPINDKTIKPILDTLNKKNQVPTLHVSGRNDTLITTEMSEIIFKYFDPYSAEFYIHKGGHYCPNDSSFRHKLQEFIQRACHS